MANKNNGNDGDFIYVRWRRNPVTGKKEYPKNAKVFKIPKKSLRRKTQETKDDPENLWTDEG